MQGITPPEIADLIADKIKGKVVCDVGCGDGTFMHALAKHASKVIGIEENQEWAYKAAEDFDVYNLTSWHQPLPPADVYWLWTIDAMGIYLKAKHEGTKGTFIFGKTVRPSLTKFLTQIHAKRRNHPTLDWWVYIAQL